MARPMKSATVLTRRIASRGNIFFRTHATSTEKSLEKSYSNTLLLPKTTFPLWSDSSKREVPFRSKTTEELYHYQGKHNTGAPVILHDGPPYANGPLHMGHALNKVLKDIINRFNVLQGFRINYVPGWDCHGLPIENKALQELKARPNTLPPTQIRTAARNTASRAIELQRSEFKEFGIMADWSEEGCYRTYDHTYEIQQLRIFQKMVQRGLIYRSHRPVYYSPSSLSALAEAELEYRDDHSSNAIYVKFPVVGSPQFQGMREGVKTSLIIWTTTPWTVPANMCIAVNPNLTYSILRLGEDNKELVIVAKERKEHLASVLGDVEEVGSLSGSDLVGTTYHHPLQPSSTYQVISARHVSADSGTGLVHIAPGHGVEDYIAFQSSFPDSNSRPKIACPIDEKGSFSSEIFDLVSEPAATRLAGKNVLSDASDEIISLLREAGAIVGEKKIKHRYPYDWKTGKPVIIRATSQWFANIDAIKAGALEALKDVKFYPEVSRSRLEAFVRERSEWCISRQRMWGVPIPSLHFIPASSSLSTASPDAETVLLSTESLEHIIKVLEEKGVNHWWDGSAEDFIPPSTLQSLEYGTTKGHWRKGTDTIDVWFDSGSSWGLFSPSERSDAQEFVCLEGSDQHRGWFQSLLLTAISSAESEVGTAEKVKAKAPYTTLITHGFVLDENGKKMSKSLGNVISPIDIIKGGKDKKKDPAHGADVLRLWAATVEYGKDVSVGPTIINQTAEMLRKIRNSARFILGNAFPSTQEWNGKMELSRKDLGIAERYVMHQLYTLEKGALESYASYNFPRVVQSLSTFAHTTLSSLYFDITKDILYADAVSSPARQTAVHVLREVLRVMTIVMAPILPHLAEEIYHVASGQERAEEGLSVFVQGWRSVDEKWKDVSADEDMKLLLSVRGVVLELLEQARRQKDLRSSLEAEVDIVIPDSPTSKLARVLKAEESFLKTLFIVSDARLGAELNSPSAPAWSYYQTATFEGEETEVLISVRKSSMSKCPRCWQWNRDENEDLCERCTKALDAD